MVVTALVFGAAIGLILGALGGGGSVLAVPVLVYVFDLAPQDAATTSLIVVGSAAVVGALLQTRAGTVSWRTALLLALTALPGAALGTWLGSIVSGRALLLLFAVAMLGVAALMWRRAGRPHPTAPQDAHSPLTRPGRLGAAGSAIGVVTGFFGVGGGFLIVPVLSLLFGVELRRAVGTSLAVIFLVASAGLGFHLLRDPTIDWAVAIPFTAGTAAGSGLGAIAARRIATRRLSRAFALLLASVGIVVLVANLVD